MDKKNEYMRIYMNNRNINTACKQYLITNGLLHVGLLQEEIQEKIKQYKIRYTLKKQRLAEKKAIVEAKRRHEFIYG